MLAFHSAIATNRSHEITQRRPRAWPASAPRLRPGRVLSFPSPPPRYRWQERAEERPDLGLWPIRLHDRLPVVPIPLATPDPSVLLDLQAVLHRVYDAADYGKYIYQETPDPQLSPDDEVWARQFVPPQE